MNILRFKVLICICFFALELSFAQKIEWFHRFRNNNTSGASLIKEYNGNLIIAGFMDDYIDLDPGVGTFYGNARDNGFIATFDSSAKPLNITYGRGRQSGEHNVNAYEIDKNGNKLVVYDESFYHNNQKLSINDDSVKFEKAFFDSEGNYYLTGRFFGTVDMDPSSVVSNIYPSSKIVVGPNESKICQSVDYFIAKYSPSNNLIFAKTFDVNHDISVARNNSGSLHVVMNWYKDVCLDAENNLLFFTYYENSIDADPGTGKVVLIDNDGKKGNLMLAKLDKNGTYVWSKNFTGDYFERDAYSVATDQKDNSIYLYYGETRGPIIQKMDKDGNEIDFKLFTGFLDSKISISDPVHYNKLKISDKGDLYIIGSEANNLNLSPNACNTIELNENSFIAKFSNNLQYVWSKNILVEYPYKNYLLTDLVIDKDDNVYFVGQGDYSSGSGTCCGAILFGKVSQQNSPKPCIASKPILDAASADVVCPNGQANLKIKGVESALWYTSICSAMPVKDSLVFKIQQLKKDTIFYVANKLCPNSFRLPVNVKVDPNRKAILTNGSNKICKGDSITLSAYAEKEITWLPYGKTSGRIAPKNDITFYLSTVDSRNCTNNSEYKVIVDTIIPNLKVTNIRPFYCEDDTLKLSIEGAFQYEIFNRFLSSSGYLYLNREIDPIIVGQIDEYVIRSYSEVCIKDTVLKMKFRSAKVDNLQLCLGDSLILEATGNADSFIWSNGIKNGSKISPSENTLYYLTSSLNNCPAKVDSFLVEVIPKPVLTITQNPVCSTHLFEYLCDNCDDIKTIDDFGKPSTNPMQFRIFGLNQGCTTDTFRIQSYETPILTINSIQNPEICFGSGDSKIYNVLLKADAGIYTETIKWNKTIKNDTTINLFETTKFIVEANNSSCVTKDSITFSLYELPRFVVENHKEIYCVGDVLKIKCLNRDYIVNRENSSLKLNNEIEYIIPTNTGSYVIFDAFYNDNPNDCNGSLWIPITNNQSECLPNSILNNTIYSSANLVFPNPSNSNKTIYINGTENIQSVTIMSTEGNFVNEVVLNNNRNFQIDGLSKGMYILKLKGSNSVRCEKIIVD